MQFQCYEKVGGSAGSSCVRLPTEIDAPDHVTDAREWNSVLEWNVEEHDNLNYRPNLESELEKKRCQ